ncbi:mammalian cell entry protein [Novimethylophilus kurashikiensis]|uniref:Mammalian cell entry protein n=1 Tax=Novimethylophilus kurashikiensis TaxID=1825523 RepID=A0A2R5FAB0_9PROT|nr:hypothetical protein [Novimethylophilus kurashikiensis]GBG14759.1 mammalian cell entry protein [Novimethylophilus kurashikiensis]
MAQLPLSCCWRPGTLRPFESVASFGAKYCYLNKIRFIDLWKMLTEFLPRNANVPDGIFALDVAEFNIGRFAHYLGESVSVAKTMILERSIPGPHLQTVSGVGISDFNHKALSFCPACLANGYHSNLHQMEWMDKCFIHGVPLKSDHSLFSTNSRLMLRLIQPLYFQWFKPEKAHLALDETWPGGTGPTWSFGDHKLICEDAMKVISMLHTAERRLVKLEKNLPRLIGNPPSSASLVMVMNIVGSSNQRLSELVNPRRLTLKRARQFSCGAAKAKAIFDLDDHDLALLMHSRQVMCAISGIRPQWRIVLDRLERQLSSGHEHCLKLLHESTFCGEKIRLGNSSQFVQAPFNRARFHSMPCDRIVTMSFFQDLQDIEEYNPFSQTSLTELSMDKYRWPSLKRLGLVDYISGFIPRNGHQIFRDDNMYFRDVDSDEADQRYCQLHAPLGVLADVIDEMILANVRSWAWALFNLERHADCLTNSPRSPEKFLRNEINKLKPIFSLQKAFSGLAMKEGTFVPIELPPWKTCLGNMQDHVQEVTALYSFFLNRLEEQINRGMHKIAFNDSLIKWLSE